MNLYVLDTDMFTLLRKAHAQVVQNYAAHLDTDQVALSVITVEEQLSGWYTQVRKAQKPDQTAHAYESLARTVEACSGWRILPFPESAILRCDQLLASRLNVRKMDLRIAAIVLENKATLVTRNLRDFQRVPNLPLEDWSQ
jgi:tRNA(fMet)-specific endonuclease VapC